MLVSLSNHLLVLMKENEQAVSAARTLKNMARFYSLYIPGIEEAIKIHAKPIFKKLDEFKKLVKWTATEDLGSSQKMSKEKNQYLEYYRLKAASEKTRRRLHKLCLDMDIVLGKPSYDYLSKDNASIGFKTLSTNKDESPSTKAGWPSVFSKRITTACDSLSNNLLKKENASDGIVSVEQDDLKDLVSRRDKLEKKMDNIGNGFTKEGVVLSYSKAIDDISYIRNAIKSQVPELRSMEGANFQKKQRSVVEILRTFRQLGISPFRYENVQSCGDLTTLFSSSSPSNFSHYDDTADDLFISCVRQVEPDELRRLHEVYDGRIRNADISKQEASKSVSFCNHLLSNSTSERHVMQLFSTKVWIPKEMSNSLMDLENIHTKDTKTIQSSDDIKLSDLTKLQSNLRRLESIGHDIEAFNILLQSEKSNARIPSLSGKNGELVSNLDVSLRKHMDEISSGDVNIISEGVRSCSKGKSELLESEDVNLLL